MFKLFWIFIFPIILSDFGRDCFGSKSRKGLPNIVKSFSTGMVFGAPLQMLVITLNIPFGPQHFCINFERIFTLSVSFGACRKK